MGPDRNGAVRPASQANAMTVGYHAPPPGSRSGVADYAETLRKALQRYGTIQADAANADTHLYHLGNNRLHEGIYGQALRTPGVVVLHDAVLQHFMLGTRSHDEYMDEWVHNYGVWRRDLGEELWRERAKAAVDSRYFQYPMLRRVVETAAGVIVHNRGAGAMALAHGAERVFTIPHFFEAGAPVDDSEATEFRERIGIEPATTLFGIFGYLRETKRVPACIAAFRKLHAVRRQTALLIAGDAVSPDLNRLLETDAAHPAIHRIGHLSDKDLGIAAATVDCAINLRYPGAGETSGIAIRLMGIGKPVICTDNAENAGFPETAILRVRPGIAENAELFDHMVLATEYPGVAREVGSEAREHIRRCHGLEQVARQYWEALCAVTS
jgi:glycosyltransferase involved in cell wall biosynthesis